MLHKLMKKLKALEMFNDTGTKLQENADNKNKPLSKDFDENLQAIRAIFDLSSDLILREFNIGTEQKLRVFAVMISGLINEASVNQNLINPLMFLEKDINKNNGFMIIKQCALSVASVKEAHTLEETVDAILSGDTALFIDGSNTVLICSIRGWEARGVDEPKTEAVVRGPREGFVEALGTNTALIRRKIKNSNLKFEQIIIGKQTKTNVCVAYIKGIANEKIVQEVKQRLTRIETDSILESGYIESFIEDAPLSLFPTVGNTEKPDVACAKLLEGRVAIITDGTPFVLTVPYLFIEAFQNAEDYYSRPFYTTFIRWLRWLGFFISTFLPAIYVAITTFHQELLPPALLVSIAAAQEGTPFPSVVEALLMQVIYEILREAGVRLPRPVGQAVSIVGALVIGEAAVSAGLVGAPMVVVVALTAISSFVVSPLADVNTISRVVMIILGGFAGLYGIMLGFAVFLIHQCSLRSLGIPYMSPLAPTTFSDLKDIFIRAPWWAMFTRPRVLGGANSVRQEPFLKPKPPEDDKGAK